MRWAEFLPVPIFALKHVAGGILASLFATPVPAMRRPIQVK
jgi:hypothetical protein